jgi:hypothetical protein
MTSKPTTIFISHASEDKTSFARPLAHALKQRGLQVWYDEFSLKLGDSLRRSIERGLAECTAGVVILSPAFFAKEWPQRELDALYSFEISGRTRILPIWHGVDATFIGRASPFLLDRLALNSNVGVEVVCSAIAEQFPPSSSYTGAQLADLVETWQAFDVFASEAHSAGCRYRFLRMNAFKEEYCRIADEAISKLSEEELENFPSEINSWLEDEHGRLRGKHGIPPDVYLTHDEPVHEDRLGSFLESIAEWASGTLSQAESQRLVHDLDLQEFDEYFVLLGIPNFSFSLPQRDLLERLIVKLGCWVVNGGIEIDELASDLRALDVA